MCMCSFRLSLSNSAVLGPFIVVLGGMEHKPAAPRHDMAPQIIWLAGKHCGYNIFLVKMLTQWPSNVHVARYKLLYGALFTKQPFLPLIESLMAMVSFSSSLVTGVAFVPACGTSVHVISGDVSKQCWSLLLYLLIVS